MIEEQLLYPAVRDVLPNGEDLKSEAEQEHQQVKEELAEIQRMDATDEEFDGRIKELEKNVKHHVREEEGEMLPEFKRRMERDVLLKMGEQMKRLKKSIKGQLERGDMDKIVMAAANTDIRVVEEEEEELETV
jgi:hypothetical protein